MRPSSADLLASQLEAASLARSTPSSPSTGGQRSPSTPWLSDSFSFNSISSSPTSSPELPRRKFVSRGPTSRRDAAEDSDEALEEELADFGYGSHKKKRPTESLLDLLNSEPPGGWPEEQPQSPPSITLPRKVNALQKKLRLGSRQSVTDEPSNRGLSTLRSFRSSSSLLGLSKSKPIIVSDPVYNMIQQPAPEPRLAAKEAAPRAGSTSDLAAFLRSSSPPRLSHSSSMSTRSSANASIASSSTNAKILKAVVAKVGQGARRASLIRSDSGSSLHRSTASTATSLGATSMFDASMRSHVLPSAQDEESLHESISTIAAQARLSRSLGSTRDSTRPAITSVKTSPGQLQRNGSVAASSATSPTHKRRLSRKPPPSMDDLDLILPRTPPRPTTKQLISDETLSMLKQAQDDTRSTYTSADSPIKGRAPLPPVPDHHRASTATFGATYNSHTNSVNSSDDSAISSSGSSITSIPNVDLPQPPPPMAPLPQVPARSASRPTSLIVSSANPFTDRRSARWSTISHAETVRRAPTPEAGLEDPTHPAETHKTLSAGDLIFSAMRRLQLSMQDAASLPLVERASGEEDSLSRSQVDALLPLLKALQVQMTEASTLLDLVVRLAEGKEDESTPSELEREEREAVHYLLGSAEGSRREE